MQRLCTLFLFCTAILSGCGHVEETQLYIYCNETFWYVMQEESLYFSNISGIEVRLIPVRADRTYENENKEVSVKISTDHRATVPWRSRPKEQDVSATSEILRAQVHPSIVQQIERISEECFGDMFLTDSQKHVEKLRTIAQSMKEYPIGYLTLTMLVPEGNPLQLTSIKDVLESNRVLGIMHPSFDGLGEASWAVLTKIIPGGESAIPMERVLLFERQYDLMEALEQENVDAALVWNSTCQLHFLLNKYADEYNAMWEDVLQETQKNREKLQHILRAIYAHIIEDKSFAEEVPLTKNPDEHYVAEIRLVALSAALNFGYCERFADYMKSNQSKEILQRFGFMPK